MNQKRKPSRGPRPAMGPKNSKHYWHRRCYPWYDYDYDYDWDWDYDTDWDYDNDWYYYSSQRRAKAPIPVRAWDEGTNSDVIMAYQAGFKDGWYAAMEYISMYSQNKPMPEPKPEPPMPPAPTTESTSGKKE